MLINNHFGLNRIQEFLIVLETIMLHPNDPNLMKQSFSKLYLDYGVDELGIDKDPPFFLFNNARKYSFNKFQTTFKHGCTAGMIFLNLVDMQELGESCSFDKALYLLMKIDNKYAKDVNAENPINSETTLRDVVWKQYRNVAHLWALQILIRDGLFSNSGYDENAYIYLGLVYEFQNRYKSMSLGFDFFEIINPQTMRWDNKQPFRMIPFDIQNKLKVTMKNGIARQERLDKIRNQLQEYSSYVWKRNDPKYINKS